MLRSAFGRDNKPESSYLPTLTRTKDFCDERDFISSASPCSFKRFPLARSANSAPASDGVVAKVTWAPKDVVRWRGGIFCSRPALRRSVKEREVVIRLSVGGGASLSSERSASRLLVPFSAARGESRDIRPATRVREPVGLSTILRARLPEGESGLACADDGRFRCLRSGQTYSIRLPPIFVSIWRRIGCSINSNVSYIAIPPTGGRSTQFAIRKHPRYSSISIEINL
jgi:hypothetical protein